MNESRSHPSRDRCETCLFWGVQRSGEPSPAVGVGEEGWCRFMPAMVPKWSNQWCGQWEDAEEPQFNHMV